MTIYLHEVHHVTGTAEDDFEAAYRDPGGWMDQLGRGDDARPAQGLCRLHQELPEPRPS